MRIDIDRIADTINQAWSASGQTIIITGMAIALVLAIIASWRTAITIKRKTKGTPVDTMISTIVTSMILALSAEGMFMVLTTKLDNPIPAYLAWAVCAVVEGLLVVLFREAEKFNKAHGRPGPYGTAFWIVAAGGGLIVAMSTTSLVEVFFRLSLPLSVAMLHWIKLTAKNGKTNKVTWLITPTRLLARLGWLTGEEETLTQAQIKRQTRKIVRAAYLFSSKKPKSRASRRASRRLREMMLDATPEIAEAVEAQILLTYGMECRVASAMLAGQSKVRDLANGHNDSVSAISTLPAQQIAQAVPAGSATASVSAPLHRPSLPAGRSNTGRSNADRDSRDQQLLAKYHDIFAKLHANGRLNRSQIERACANNGDKVLARQANRLMTMMLASLGDVEG